MNKTPKCKSRKEAIRTSIEHGRAFYDDKEYGQYNTYRDGILLHTVQIVYTDEQLADLRNGIEKPISEYTDEL